MENDAFVKHGTDEHYTHGSRFAYAFGDARWWPRFLKDWSTRFDFPEHRATAARDRRPNPDLQPATTWIPLGQNLYTPRNIDASQLLIGDRPYGAYLYTGVLYSATNQKDYEGLESDIGVTGPLALGRETQTKVHQILGIHTPKGWSHQIRGEPGIELQYDRRRAILEEFICKTYRVLDLVPHAGVTAGNIMTFAAVGATLRAGFNLSPAWPVRIPATVFATTPPASVIKSLGPERTAVVDTVQQARHQAAQQRAESERRWYELYFIAGIEERAVLRNIFLDGNTFDRGYHVNKNTSVFDYDVGVVARVFWFTLAYRRFTRSPEFSPGDRPHRFGSITVAIGHPY